MRSEDVPAIGPSFQLGNGFRCDFLKSSIGQRTALRRLRPATAIEPRKSSGFSPSATKVSAPLGSITVNMSPLPKAAAMAPISCF